MADRIGKKRSELVGGMYRYVSNVVTLAIEQNKKLIVWGCGKGGAFLTHLICDIDGRLPVTYYIDEHMVLPCGKEAEIYRSSLLWYIPQKEYIVLLSIRRDEESIRILEQSGYVAGESYFDVRSDIGGSYLEYLEMNHPGVDFSYVTKEDRPDLYSGEYFESKPFDHSSIDRVFEELSDLPCERSFFDIGCGRGQMLVMAAMVEMDKIGGVELNTELVKSAKRNLEALGIQADVEDGDATTYIDIDGYNIFFLYNPFGRDAIRKVAENIKDSVKKTHRDAYLVYGNPFYHKTVMDVGGFTIYKQVKVDLHDPLLNIYRIQG